MVNSIDTYSDDNGTREALRKVASSRTLHEIYGLFYGCLAAPGTAAPSQYVDLIVDPEHAASGTDDDILSAQDNLISLWNFITRWRPEDEPFYFPETEYPAVAQGLRQHLTDTLSMIQYFIAGLNLGGAEETDFSEDAIDAMHALTEATARLQENIRRCENDEPNAVDEDPDSTTEMFDEIEDIVADCIARVTVGLKQAKR